MRERCAFYDCRFFYLFYIHLYYIYIIKIFRRIGNKIESTKNFILRGKFFPYNKIEYYHIGNVIRSSYIILILFLFKKYDCRKCILESFYGGWIIFYIFIKSSQHLSTIYQIFPSQWFLVFYFYET